MGLTYATITIINGLDQALCRKGKLPCENVKKMDVEALVDTGAYMLTINDNVRIQLDLDQTDEQIAELADGQKIKLPIVGPIEIRFKNRRANVDAMVLPGDSEILLGVIPMEDMDVIVDPKTQQLIVNPKSPYIIKKPLK